ncbi:MAG: DUF1028 domain-containing protein [Planctomycetes bacterium]|nr:DUF1028 domain-containing protein [Planctomycetota bacterium]
MATLVFFALLAASPPARATFSIVAVDPATGEIGGAGASCIDGVAWINDIVRGVGAVHTQALGDDADKARARQRMVAGDSPQEIMDFVAPFDTAGNRQYGAVDLRDGVARSAAYTGANTFAYAGHILGPTYAIQGNILLGPEILTGMEKAFLETPGELAVKLMAALQAANVPRADTRCSTRPSISAFVRVARPDDPTGLFYCDLDVANTFSDQNPIDLLQALFDDWKLLPIAAFAASPEAGDDPLEVAFDAAASRAIEGASIASYAWTFGDGGTGTGVTARHTFALPGKHAVTLAVTDDAGRSRRAQRTIDVRFRPGNAQPWTSIDIGSPAAGGAARLEDGCLTSIAGGLGFLGRTDQGHLAYQEASGDLVLAAEVRMLRSEGTSGATGVMLRASAAEDSPFAAVLVEQSGTRRTFRLRYREAAGALAKSLTGPDAELPGAWVRLSRRGGTVTGETSRDGASWSELGSAALDLPRTLIAGVATAARSSTGVRCAARVCSVTLAPALAFLRGDCYGDGDSSGVSDAIYLLAFNFLGGPAPPCRAACDSNGDGDSGGVSDAIHLLAFNFLGGPAPPGPFPACGPPSLPADGSLGCERPPEGCE